MSFFISDAMAEAAAGGAQQGGNPMASLLFMVVIFAVFYFMLIRPQQKRAKDHKKMTAALQKITQVSDEYVSLQIADNVEIKVQRSAVGTLLPKGSIKEVNK